jgi:SAM-dependent methyltransferase
MDVMIKSGGRRTGLFAQMTPGRVLDVPSGGGLQSRALEALGYSVVSIDLFTGAHSGERKVCADANLTLPFRDGVFDYVLSREGIEHLENQVGFVRECGRVLRPGGQVVITTPSLMHLSSRMSQLLTSQRNLRRGLANEVQTLRVAADKRLYHGHIFLIDYFRMRYILRLAGFDRLRVYTDQYSPTSVALAWCVPILYAASKFSLRTAARNAQAKHRPVTPDDVAKEILAHVFSPAMLFGKRMIVVAEKSAAASIQSAIESKAAGRYPNDVVAIARPNTR